MRTCLSNNSAPRTFSERLKRAGWLSAEPANGVAEANRELFAMKLLHSILITVVVTSYVARAGTAWSETAASRLNLSLEQAHVVKELVKDLKIEPGNNSVLWAGERLPDNVTMIPMPDEIGRRISQIKSHLLSVGTKQIWIVDPKDHTVVETIPR